MRSSSVEGGPSRTPRCLRADHPPHGRSYRGRWIPTRLCDHRHSGTYHTDHAPPHRAWQPVGNWAWQGTHPGKSTQQPAWPARFLAHCHPGPWPRFWHGCRIRTTAGPTIRSLGDWLVAVGFHPRVALGTRRQVCTPPSQRDERIPCSSRKRASDQETDPNAVG